VGKVTDPPREPGPRDPGEPEDRREPPSAGQISDQIAREILQIHEESYGKGAGKAHALVGDGFVVVVLDQLELLPNEQFLVENGEGDTVVQVRGRYQQAIESTFSAAIERATGRTVVGFDSSTNIDEPRFVAEIFKLE
jgi:uncharacterized protein YbcI